MLFLEIYFMLFGMSKLCFIKKYKNNSLLLNSIKSVNFKKKKKKKRYCFLSIAGKENGYGEFNFILSN